MAVCRQPEQQMDGVQEQTHSYMHSSFLAKVQRPAGGESTASMTYGVRTTGHPRRKQRNVNPYLKLYTKINLKWITELNTNCKL